MWEEMPREGASIGGVLPSPNLRVGQARSTGQTYRNRM